MGSSLVWWLIEWMSKLIALKAIADENVIISVRVPKHEAVVAKNKGNREKD